MSKDQLEYRIWRKSFDHIEDCPTWDLNQMREWLWGQPHRSLWVYAHDKNVWYMLHDKTEGNWTQANPPEELRARALLGM